MCDCLDFLYRKVEDSDLYKKWVKQPGPRQAYELSVFSCVLTAAAFIIGIALAAVTGSSATLGYALENFVDLFSSLIVVWRFWGKEDDNEKLEHREKRASIAIAFMMCILGLVVFGVAADHLVQAHEINGVHILVTVSVPSMIIFSIVAWLKFHMASHMNSPAMKKDAVCSSAGAVLSLGVFMGAALFSSDSQIWWFDAVVAVAIGGALFIYGMRTLVRNIVQGNNYFSLSYWRTGFAKFGSVGLSAQDGMLDSKDNPATAAIV